MKILWARMPKLLELNCSKQLKIKAMMVVVFYILFRATIRVVDPPNR